MKFLELASSYAANIENLFFSVTAITIVCLLIAYGILGYFLVKYRKKDGVRTQYITGEEHSQVKWLHLPHYLVMVIDVFIIAFAIYIWIDVKQTLPKADETVKILGRQWAWVFTHPGQDQKIDTDDDIQVVNELHVKKDTTYHYKLFSADVVHSFSVPVFRLKQDAVPGRVITGWFKPIKTGEFDVQCAEMCGIGHGVMGARIYIHDDASYKKWVESQPTIVNQL